MNLLGKNLQELLEITSELGEEPFRGKQLYHLLYKRKEFNVPQMSELPLTLRKTLSQNFQVQLPELENFSESLDGTVKLLFRLYDGQFVETVVIPEKERTTLCISSQVGCNVGCTFCLTAQMGFSRNLKPSEILGQVLIAIKSGYVASKGFNIVFMGMGEPLYNYKHVMKSFRIMVDAQGMGLSRRRITISTSGVIPILEKMYFEPILPNLAISLNATTDTIRDQIMPLNKKWPLQKLLDCCRLFPLESRRRITFEYVLIKDLTDSKEDARRLSNLVKGIRCKVNLIPYNSNPGMSYTTSSQRTVEQFKKILVQNHISVFIRKTRGEDISGACGQLAYLENTSQKT